MPLLIGRCLICAAARLTELRPISVLSSPRRCRTTDIRSLTLAYSSSSPLSRDEAAPEYPVYVPCAPTPKTCDTFASASSLVSQLEAH